MKVALGLLVVIAVLGLSEVNARLLPVPVNVNATGRSDLMVLVPLTSDNYSRGSWVMEGKYNSRGQVFKQCISHFLF